MILRNNLVRQKGRQVSTSQSFKRCCRLGRSYVFKTVSPLLDIKIILGLSTIRTIPPISSKCDDVDQFLIYSQNFEFIKIFNKRCIKYAYLQIPTYICFRSNILSFFYNRLIKVVGVCERNTKAMICAKKLFSSSTWRALNIYLPNFSPKSLH